MSTTPVRDAALAFTTALVELKSSRRADDELTTIAGTAIAELSNGGDPVKIAVRLGEVIWACVLVLGHHTDRTPTEAWAMVADAIRRSTDAR